LLSAVILAGGRASRLGGADKPGITVAGRTLVAAVGAAAAGAGARRLVVVGPDRPELPSLLEDIAAPGVDAGPAITVEFTRENPAGSGPAPAIAAGLQLVREPWVLLLAADLPFLRSWHLRELARAAVTAAGGAVLLDGESRPQWLTSCWPAAPLRAALSDYAGHSLSGLLGPMAPAYMRLDPAADPARDHAGPDTAGPPPWLDCDTPEDLAAARRLAEEEPDEHAGPLDRGGLRRA
jgi:molybdenum cofactor guanylyltransferase